jgi:hypothetical protein
MNATCNDTLFEIVGSWVVDLSQLGPASNLPRDGFDSGAIFRELIWVPASLYSPRNYARRCTQFPTLSPRILYQNHQDQIDPEPDNLFLFSVWTPKLATFLDWIAYRSIAKPVLDVDTAPSISWQGG